LRLRLRQFVLERLEPGRQGLRLGHHGLHFRFGRAFALELADLLGQGIAARLLRLGFGLDGLAAGLQLVEPGDVEIDATALEAVDDGLQVFAQQYRI